MNEILKNAKEVYKNREKDFYLETIRKTADELEKVENESNKFLAFIETVIDYLTAEQLKQCIIQADFTIDDLMCLSIIDREYRNKYVEYFNLKHIEGESK